MMRAIFFGLLLASSFALPVYAQFNFESARVSLLITPEHPTPGDTVRIVAESSGLDLEAYDVAWYTNGERIKDATGLQADVVAGPLGSETNVNVLVSSEGFEVASARAIIRPVEIDLLWESDSYVPAFYRGRSLPSAGTALRMEALARFKRPNGALLSPSDIIYTWRKNGSVQPVSGRGKSSVSISSPPLFGGDTISVEAQSLDGSLVGSASVRIPSVEPSLVLYEDHPLFGIMYHRAFAPQTITPQVEMTFAAVPYFAEARNPEDLIYAWRVNGRTVVSGAERQSRITINAANSSGHALIELALSSVSNFFLSRAGSWTVSLAGNAGGVVGSDPFGGIRQ